MEQSIGDMTVAQLAEERVRFGVTLAEIAVEHAKRTNRKPVGVQTVCNVLKGRRTSRGIVEAAYRCIARKKPNVA